MRCCLAFILLLIFSATANGQELSARLQEQQLEQPEEQRPEQPRDSEQRLDTTRKRGGIFGLMERNFGIDQQEELDAERDQQNFERYEGYVIRDIYVDTDNIADTASRLWIDRTVNSLHAVTRPGVIRNDLFFKSGDRLDPVLMMNNRQLIQSRNYISDIEFTIVPVPGSTSEVDIHIRTRDTWTISLDTRIDGDGETNLRVFDKNIGGVGGTLGISSFFNWRHGGYGGNLVDFDMPNIAGTFFSGNVRLDKAFDRHYVGAMVNKEFITDFDHAGGASFMKSRDTVEILYLDTTIHYSYQKFEVWAGKAFRLGALGNSIYATARYFSNRFLDRPRVEPEYNPFFHDQKAMLASVGVYRERFRTATRIYGYGVEEYVAYGYKAELTGGYSWGEFNDVWYAGGSFKAGRFYRFGYLALDVGLGTSINGEGKFFRTSLVSNITYFSPLINLGSRYQIRQFTNFNLTRGWNRVSGFRETLAFVDAAELHGLQEPVFGQNRLVMRNETVFFTPWRIHGFRFAAYTFADLGLIGDRANFFQNDFYATLGAGVRIKNERLIFATVNIRLGFALSSHGFIDADYFRLSNKNIQVPIRYIPQRAQPVEYR